MRTQIDKLRRLKRRSDDKLGAAARPLQFIVVGSTGLVVDLLCYMLLMRLLPIQVARAVAIWLAMTSNFWLNRRITFSYARKRHPIPQYFLFCSSCLFGAVVNWLVSIGLYNSIDFFTDWPVAAALCGGVAGTGFNYVLSSLVVFRRQQENDPSDGAHPAADEAKVGP